jgi:hypothetical protein
VRRLLSAFVGFAAFCATAAFHAVDVSPNENLSGLEVRAKDADPGHLISQDDLARSLVEEAWESYYDCLRAAIMPPCLGPPARYRGIYLDTGSITPRRVEEAVRQVGLPGLAVTTQPADTTLVNVATIFFADPAPVNDTVSILGHLVRISGAATAYTWHFGDGSHLTTADPGAPYPEESVTHRYQRVAEAVPVSMTVAYHVKYSVDGQPWLDLAESITEVGPPTTLRVIEAEAVLVAPSRVPD